MKYKIMGREIRKVPAGWEHPKKSDGRWHPQYEEFYGDVMAKWLKEHNLWLKGKHPDQIKDPSLKEQYPFFAMWNGNPPDVNYYRTKKYKPEELTHIQLYESTSEGTPDSPVFRADEFEKLCEWAAENSTTFAHFTATKEQWMKMLGEGFVHHQEGNIVFM